MSPISLLGSPQSTKHSSQEGEEEEGLECSDELYTDAEMNEVWEMTSNFLENGYQDAICLPIQYTRSKSPLGPNDQPMFRGLILDHMLRKLQSQVNLT